jgi:Fur family iron response transcriptional regulator
VLHGRAGAYNFICNDRAAIPFDHESLPSGVAMTQSRPFVPGAAASAFPVVQARTPQGRADLTGCPWHDVKEKLREVGLRPTRQRMALGWILFAKGDRHVTAEMLYEEANRAKVAVSLATVYNTLHQFTEVGLLRQVAIDGSKTYFDTNNSEHHHFFIEDQNDLMDIPSSDVVVGKAPIPPEGYEIARIDVVVRLRRKSK